MLRTALPFVCLPLLLTLGLTGCGDDASEDGSGGATGSTTTSTATSGSPTGATGATSGSSAGGGGAGPTTTSTGTNTSTGQGGDGGGSGGGSAAVPLIGPRPVAETPLAEGTLFASPDGAGTSCSEAAPCSLIEATEQATAGDVVFLRGGVYAVRENVYFRGVGTDPAPVVFESFPGEWAILDGGDDPNTEFYVRVTGDPVRLRRFEVRGMPQAGISVRSSDNVLEGLDVHDNRLSGIHIHESYEVPVSNRNLIRDCIVQGNSDAGLKGGSYADGGNADGISISSGIENRVEHCLAYGNSDDGIDTWRSLDTYVGYTIVGGSGIASGNGQGFKSGGAAPSRGTFVEHCLSFSNQGAGFTNNSGLEVTFVNNTSWDNAGGFEGGDDTRMQGNIAAEGNTPNLGVHEDNSWQRDGAPAFISLDPTSPDFLVPTVGGGFEDIGAYAGL